MQETPIDNIKKLINEVYTFEKHYCEMLSKTTEEPDKVNAEELTSDDIVECTKIIKQKLSKLSLGVRKKCKEYLDYKVDIGDVDDRNQ